MTSRECFGLALAHLRIKTLCKTVQPGGEGGNARAITSFRLPPAEHHFGLALKMAERDRRLHPAWELRRSVNLDLLIHLGEPRTKAGIDECRSSQHPAHSFLVE